MLQKIWSGVQAIIQLLTSLFDTISNMGKGAIESINIFVSGIGAIVQHVFPFIKVLFSAGSLGILIIGGAIAVFVGSIWEAIN